MVTNLVSSHCGVSCSFNYYLLLFKAMTSLGSSCGLKNLEAEIEELRTKTLDLFTPRMKSLRGLFSLLSKKYTKI